MAAHPFITQVLSTAAWLVLLVAIFVPLERLFALHPAAVWRKQVGVDLGWYFVNALLPATSIALPLAWATEGLRRMDPGGFYSTVAAWPFWLKLLPVLIVNDIGAYWGHRALHAFPRLWRFHAIHHSAEHMDWLVNTRAHPFDIVFMRMAGLSPIFLLGLAGTMKKGQVDPAVMAVTFFALAWNFFLHSNIRVRLGPLEWVISSPAFHHWHHTSNEYRDRNFAFIFPVIDRVFGTAWLPEHWPEAYGIDEKVSSTLSGQFFDPLEPASWSADEHDREN